MFQAPKLAALTALIVALLCGVSFAEEGHAELSKAQADGYFATITELLTDAKTQYEAGDTRAANENLINAYLENFEYLEGPLEAVDEEMMEGLEHTLREDLPKLITDAVSSKAFNSAVDAAQQELDKAQALLK